MGKSSGSRPDIPDDTFQSEDIVEFTLGISEGPIAGLVGGPKTLYLDDTPLVSQVGSLNFNKFEVHEYRGSDGASKIRNVLGGTSSNVSVGVKLAGDVWVTRTTPAELRGKIDSIDIRLVVNQAFNAQDNGSVSLIPINFVLQYREVGTTEWQALYVSEPPLSQTGQYQENMKITSPAVREFTKQVPRIDNDWEVRVLLFGYPTDEWTLDVSWESFQLQTNEHRSYDNLAALRVLSEASDQLNGVPNLSGDYHGLITKIPSNYDPVTRHYDGVWDGTFKDGFHDNPAWALYDQVMNEVYGAKAYHPGVLLDRFSVYAAAQWCDGLVPRAAGGFQPRYTYNDVISQRRGGNQSLLYLAGLFGGRLVEDPSGMLVLKIDQPGVPKQILGPESVGDSGFSYSYTDVETRPNYFEVEFINPDLNWEKDTRIVELPEFVAKHGRTKKKFTAVGCIDVYEAQRRGMLQLLRANTETQTVTFQIPRQGLLLGAFDLVGIADPTMNWGLSGRIKSVAGSTLHLRDPLLVPSNTDMTLTVQTPSGPHEVTVRSATVNTKELDITSGVFPLDAPERAQFSLEEGSIGLVKPFRILSIVENREDVEKFDVTALEFNQNKFGDAEAGMFSGTVDYSKDLSKVPEVTDLTAESGTGQLIVRPNGEVESRILVQWGQSIPKIAEVHYRRGGADQLDKFQVLMASGGSAYIPNAVDGEVYDINVRLEGGPFTVPLKHTVVGMTQVPAQVTGWTAKTSLGYVHLSGPVFPEVDFDFFRFYGAPEGEVFANATLVGETSTTNFSYLVDENDPTRVFWVSAVDTSGNEGPASDPITVTPAGLDEAIEASGLKLTSLRGDIEANAAGLIDETLTGYFTNIGQQEEVLRIDTEYKARINEAEAQIAEDYVLAASIDFALASKRSVLSASLGLNNLILSSYPPGEGWTNFTETTNVPPETPTGVKYFVASDTVSYEDPIMDGNAAGKNFKFTATVDTSLAPSGLEISLVDQDDAPIAVQVVGGGNGWQEVDAILSPVTITTGFRVGIRAVGVGETAYLGDLRLWDVANKSNLTADIENLQVVMTTADQALAADATVLKTDFENFEATAYSIFQTSSDVNSAIASYNLNLNSTFSNLENEVDGINTDINNIQNNYVTSATLTQNYRTEASTDTAISSAITNQTVSFEGNNVSLQTISTALDGVRGKWGVEVNNNGVVSGVKLVSDIVDGGGVSSSFKVQADRFSFVTPGNTTGIGAKTPFEIAGSYIRMTGEVLIDGSLVVVSNLPKSSLNTTTQAEINEGVQALSDVGVKPDTYQQTTAPSSPKAGDIWIDTTTNKVKRYSGAVWQSAALEAESVVAGWVYAGSINAAQIDTGVLFADQIALNGQFLENDGTGNIRIKSGGVTGGELAVDVVADIQQGVNDSAQAITDASNAQTAADAAQGVADGKPDTYQQTTPPSSPKDGDIWIDTTTNKVKRYSSTVWQSAEIEAESVSASWVYAGILTAEQVTTGVMDTSVLNIDGLTLINDAGVLKIGDLDATSVTTGVLDATRINLNGTQLTAVSGVLHIAGGGVTGTEIDTDAVDSVHIAPKAVGITEFDTASFNELSALKADLGEMTAGSIDTMSAGAGIQVNVPGKPKAFYAYQDELNTYAMYAESTITGGGAVQFQSPGGFTGQFINTTNGSHATFGPYAALDVQSTATGGGGQAQIGVCSDGGGYAFEAKDGGFYDSSGDGYAPFTGSHDAMMLRRSKYTLGDIVCDKRVIAKSLSDCFTEVEVSTRRNQPAALGVISRAMDKWNVPASFVDKEATKAVRRAHVATKRQPGVAALKSHNPDDYKNNYRLIFVNSVGEGCINVCGLNGDIEKGDLIVASGMRGKGQRQDDDAVRSYTVAKARESVRFSRPNEVAQIACIYLCG